MQAVDVCTYYLKENTARYRVAIMLRISIVSWSHTFLGLIRPRWSDSRIVRTRVVVPPMEGGCKSLMWKDIVWLSCGPSRVYTQRGGDRSRGVHLNQLLIKAALFERRLIMRYQWAKWLQGLSSVVCNIKIERNEYMPPSSFAVPGRTLSTIYTARITRLSVWLRIDINKKREVNEVVSRATWICLFHSSVIRRSRMNEWLVIFCRKSLLN